MSEFPNTEAEPRPQEVERKWIVGEVPSNLHEYEHASIRQGYIAIAEDGTEVRLRDKNGSYTQTVKSKGDLVRGEWEEALSKQQFDAFWATTEGKRVEKTRYAIPHGDHIIELDIYEGALTGLMTAEVEFPDITTAGSFQAPDWLSVDVTADKAFKNQNLAIHGLPQ